MTRKKSTASLESDLERIETEMIKTKERYEKLSAEYKNLRKEVELAEINEIMTAYKKSKKTRNELLAFLKA